MISRREFMKFSLNLAVAGGFVSPHIRNLSWGASLTPRYETLEETRSIGFPQDYYYGWPTVAKRGKELLVAASGGREGHVCPFGRVELLRSKDNGKTWSWPQVLYDGPIDDRDAGICVTSDGTILVTTFTSLAYVGMFEEETRYRREGRARKNIWSDARYEKWAAVHQRLSDEEKKRELGCWLLRSTDGGVTWSERISTPFNSPHGPIQLSDGRLLYMGTELWTKEHRNGVSISKDDGRTWEVAGFIPTREGDNASYYYELHAVEASDGTLVAHIRNGNVNNTDENLQTISKDGGKTWSVPKAIGVWGIPSFLNRLQDGRLLMTYGHRRAPLGIQARISENNGESWSDPMILYGDASDTDMGYPSTVQLDDGSLFTVWYEHMRGSWFARLRCKRWRLCS